MQREAEALLDEALRHSEAALKRPLDKQKGEPAVQETGTVLSIGSGIARVSGLAGVQADELVEFGGGSLGIAFNLDENEVGVVMLGPSEGLWSGTRVRRTGRVVDIPVGEGLLGRVIDATGRPLDDAGPLSYSERWPVEREAPPIMARAPVTEPLQTGLKVVDALIPIGRGQRELILGDRQIGKTAIALDTIINQADKDMLCVYCAIGQQGAAVARVIARLRETGAMRYSIVVIASGDDPPGLRYIALRRHHRGWYFMEQGRDVLIVYDDPTMHARAYRSFSAPGAPATASLPGNIFYIHSRLLERSTRLREEFGGGSSTALPIIETQAQNISAYIPPISFPLPTGDLPLPELFRKNHLPAVDVGRSVSGGGKTQLPPTGGLPATCLSYTQFEELEMFARFGTRLTIKPAQPSKGAACQVLTSPSSHPSPSASRSPSCWR